MRLIDADALTRRFKVRGCFKKDMLGAMVAKIINTSPTIEAEPVRHGRWDAKIMKDIGTYTVYWCSECNCYSYFKYNYCPDCGSKMDGDSHADKM